MDEQSKTAVSGSQPNTAANGTNTILKDTGTVVVEVTDVKVYSAAEQEEFSRKEEARIAAIHAKRTADKDALRAAQLKGPEVDKLWEIVEKQPKSEENLWLQGMLHKGFIEDEADLKILRGLLKDEAKLERAEPQAYAKKEPEAAAQAEAKEARTRNREEAAKFVAEGLLLPAEAEALGSKEWMGIRYEESSGDFMIKREDQSWMKVSETKARKHLREWHDIGNSSLNEIRKRSKHWEFDVNTVRELAGTNPSAAVNRINNSELDEALFQIRQYFAVKNSGPRAGFYAGTILDQNGEIFLVTTSPKLIEPEEGECPTINRLVDGLFRDKKKFFLAWLKDAYKSLQIGEINTGKLLVMVGRRNCGKSLAQNHLITPLLGGRITDPYPYMAGHTEFCAELSECEHWMIQDQGDTDEKGRRKMAESIKQGVANELVLYHPKFGARKLVKAYRRWSISCNDDPKYLNILPRMDDSLVDKMLVLQAFEGGVPEEYHPREKWKEYREKIYAELPAFLFDLLNQELGDEGKGRFDVADYQDPAVLSKMEEITPEQQSDDILDVIGEDWTDYLTTTEVLALLSKRLTSQQMKPLYPNRFGRTLSDLVKNRPERYGSRFLDGRWRYTRLGHKKG
jgi:hypothetical protein